MLYAIMGFFKPGIDPDQPSLAADLNEHLAQPAMQVRLAGFFRDDAGRKTGVMALLEADSIDRARAYLEASPYFTAGLYERCEVVAYDLEVGRLP